MMFRGVNATFRLSEGQWLRRGARRIGQRWCRLTFEGKLPVRLVLAACVARVRAFACSFAFKLRKVRFEGLESAVRGPG